MGKKMNEKQIKELTHIKDWCITILNFIISKNKHLPELNIFIELVNSGYEEQNLRGMKYVIKDINEWAKGLTQSDLDELNNLLRNKFGEDLVKDSSKILTKIKQIVKNGKIANEDEYRLLLSRIDEVHGNVNKKNEVEKLNKLLVDYHK